MNGVPQNRPQCIMSPILGTPKKGPVPPYTMYYIPYAIYSISYYIILYYTILYYIILYDTILYYTILYYILYTIYYILYTIYYILYTIYYILYTILYYTLYYTIYYTILYYTIRYAILGPLIPFKEPSWPSIRADPGDGFEDAAGGSMDSAPVPPAAEPLRLARQRYLQPKRAQKTT